MIIPRKCQVCGMMIWWWDKNKPMEVTPDFGLNCHEECFTEESYAKILNEWMGEVLKEASQN